MTRNMSTANDRGLKRVVRLAERLPDRWLCTGRAESDDVPTIRSSLDALLAIAEPASYGDGERTVVDEAVRRTLQIEGGGNLTFSEHFSDGWEERGLPAALRKIESQLIVTPGVSLEADLDKILIYRPGDFFRLHRDSKKDPSHLLTLSVICGGYEDRRATGGGAVEFPCEENGSCDDALRESWEGRSPGSYACWFNGEAHRVSPVVGGHRVALQYTVKVVRSQKNEAVRAVASATPMPHYPSPPLKKSRRDHQTELSGLGEDVLGSIVEFLRFQDQKTLSETCHGFRCFNDPLRLMTRLINEETHSLRSSLTDKKEKVCREEFADGRKLFDVTKFSLTRIGLFLQHDYSLDGNHEVDPLHIRGSDAILWTALSAVFPKCRLSARKSCLADVFVLDEEQRRDPGTHDISGYDSEESLKEEDLAETMVFHDTTPFTNSFQNLVAEYGKPPRFSYLEPLNEGEDEDDDDTNNYDDGEAAHKLLPEFQRLLPPGKTRVKKNILEWLVTPTVLDDETSGYDEKGTLYWPFFQTLFVLREGDQRRLPARKEREREPTQFNPSGFIRWGNSACFQMFWYTSVALLVSLDGDDQLDDVDDVVTHPDHMILISASEKGLINPRLVD